MNIISNCCLGGFITRDVLHEPFSNPFVWAWLTTEDVCHTIQHYTNINFRNFRIKPHHDEIVEDCCFDVLVDNQITIVNSHYRFNSNYKTEFIDKQRNIVESDHIWEYVVNKYIERVKRMEQIHEQPVFILCDNRNGYGIFTESQIKLLASQHLYKVVFCSEYDYSNYSSNMFCFIHKNGNLLHEIVQEQSETIKDFILPI